MTLVWNSREAIGMPITSASMTALSCRLAGHIGLAESTGEAQARTMHDEAMAKPASTSWPEPRVSRYWSDTSRRPGDDADHDRRPRRIGAFSLGAAMAGTARVPK